MEIFNSPSCCQLLCTQSKLKQSFCFSQGLLLTLRYLKSEVVVLFDTSPVNAGCAKAGRGVKEELKKSIAENGEIMEYCFPEGTLPPNTENDGLTNRNKEIQKACAILLDFESLTEERA